MKDYKRYQGIINCTGRPLEDRVVKRYNQLSGVYDFLLDHVAIPRFFKADDEVHKIQLKRLFEGEKIERVLDLGCGTASIIEHMPDLRSYYGMDFSKDQLSQAKKRLEEQKIDPFYLFEVDIHEIPLVDAYFETAVSSLTFNFLEDPKKALEEAARVLKPGGRFYLIMPLKGQDPDYDALMLKHRSDPFYGSFLSYDELGEMALDAGFATVEKRLENGSIAYLILEKPVDR
jgi:ubiquinone/menaquinone biosynthesis C-methylase UbiE